MKFFDKKTVISKENFTFQGYIQIKPISRGHFLKLHSTKCTASSKHLPGKEGRENKKRERTEKEIIKKRVCPAKQYKILKYLTSI